LRTSGAEAAAGGLAPGLETLYRAYTRRRYVHPDPLELLYRYADPGDQEVAGLIAACLAYGRVAQILTSVSAVLDVMQAAGPGGSPRRFLETRTPAEITGDFRLFVHRFTRGDELAALLIGIKNAIARHGSLRSLFVSRTDTRDPTILPALSAFVGEMRILAGAPCPSLLSSPRDGSACKRLNLFLRWMVRRDAVDPGPWAGSLRPAALVVPLDTHLYRISAALGFTRRRSADLRTALEVTAAFRALRPRDPVRYDFCLTRLGIRRGCADDEPAVVKLECALLKAAAGRTPKARRPARVRSAACPAGGSPASPHHPQRPPR
jgi:uncharacterized protein (TIGR02757 family)